jgi:hypothetical protein
MSRGNIRICTRHRRARSKACLWAQMSLRNDKTRWGFRICVGGHSCSG